jgi:hypothetical protein
VARVTLQTGVGGGIADVVLDVKDSSRTEKKAWFERLLFSFMGPPQVGDVNAPLTYVPDRAATLCHKCRQPWDDHEIVRTGTMTYAVCPQV